MSKKRRRAPRSDPKRRGKPTVRTVRRENMPGCTACGARFKVGQKYVTVWQGFGPEYQHEHCPTNTRPVTVRRIE